MTDHDHFDRSLSERLRAHEARVPGSAAPDLATVGAGSVMGRRPAWGWGALVATGGVAAGLIMVILLNGRPSPPTGEATATPHPTSSASETAAPSASTVPSPLPLSSLAGLIAFSRDGDVYTMRPDGSDVKRLTDDPTSGSGPVAWLTDGSRLVIGRSDNVNDPNAAYPSTLTLVLPDGTDPISLGVVPQQYSQLSYSPNGTMIAFGGDGGNGTGIAVLDLVNGTLTQLTTDGGHGYDAVNGLLWSADGTRIAYQAFDGTTNDVRIVALDGSSPVTLAPDPSTDYPIRWTDVNGTLKLVFGSWRGTDESKFAARPWVVNADGTDVQLLADSGLDLSLANLIPPTRVSLDGRWIAFACVGVPGGDGGLCLRAADGTDSIRVFEPGMGAGDVGSFSPTWSPDGGYLAYAVIAGRDQPPIIKIVFLAGGEPVPITAPGAWDSAPIWQPVPD